MRAEAGRVPTSPTGNPVVDIAAELGAPGETYEAEYDKLVAYLKKSADVLGPTAPVIFVDSVRRLYALSGRVTADTRLRPYEKCVLLFRVFDAVVLAYKNVGFVYCDVRGARSVYGYSESVLKNLLSRVEAVAGRVAAAVHDAYSLTVLNEVVASAEQRLSQVRSERDMSDFFRAVSGGRTDGSAYPSAHGAAGSQLPAGVETYTDPYDGVHVLLRRLYRYASDRDYVREFHDAVYLLATANAPATLSSALETRMADKDRNVLLLDVPGDRTFASTLCASAIAYLRDVLTGPELEGARGGGTSAPATDIVRTYRINYGRIFSKYRGESERNFTAMMEWIKNAVRGGDKFRVFWFPDVENLMAPRTSNDQEHIATIKNAMLQHMDDFNKDKTLRSFLLLFHSSEGALDVAFSRRLETVVRAPAEPLRDVAVAAQAVSAELTRYRINLTDSAVARVAGVAGSESVGDVRVGSTTSRVAGFAYVQAALRDMYVNQKLILKYGAVSVDVANVSADRYGDLFGRYVSTNGVFDNSVARFDVLYDLDGRVIDRLDVIAKVAFDPSSAAQVAAHLDTGRTVPIRYNSDVRGDPKDIGPRESAGTVFLHG